MTQAMSAPVTGRDRLTELDIIRGFALFGVLWMNLYEHSMLAMPEGALDKLATVPVDRVVRFFSNWLMLGKAQALFSFLFGLGFALFLDRAERREANGTWLYVRRLSFLLVLGVAHLLLLWTGDILNAYAAMGFVLILTRRWPGWLLLTVGLALTLLGTLTLRVLTDLWLAPGGHPWWQTLQDAGAARRFVQFQTTDYFGYVRELWLGATDELYLTPIGVIFLGWILGRFMIGSWIYRQGWMQDTARYADGFRKWAPILLVSGLAIAAVGPTLFALGIKAPPPWNYGLNLVGRLAQTILPLGYAAGIVVLCQNPVWVRRFASLGATGQMALTNYLMQSLVYFFVLYGYGFGLLPYAGATFCLVLALVVFAAQMAFSRWWLGRYHFGPAEWVWRAFTYGSFQPIRRKQEEAALPA